MVLAVESFSTILGRWNESREAFFLKNSPKINLELDTVAVHMFNSNLSYHNWGYITPEPTVSKDIYFYRIRIFYSE